nr:uncharacterized protein LOC109186828 [Ipomoea trifida]
MEVLEIGRVGTGGDSRLLEIGRSLRNKKRKDPQASYIERITAPGHLFRRHQFFNSSVTRRLDFWFSAAMASRTDPQIPNEQKVLRTRKQPPFMMLLPLVYAPVLPLIRISLRHNPVVRDRLFYGVLAGAFAHGLYLMYDGTGELFAIFILHLENYLALHFWP